MNIAENSGSVAAWRKAKRAELVKTRLDLSPETHRELSLRVRDYLFDICRVRGSGAIGLYFPFRGEINLVPLARQIVAWGGSTSLPVVVAKGQPLEFRAWKPGEALNKGVLGIPIPANEMRVEPEMLLVPLVGFDAACYRLGNGGGYYDMTLQAARNRPVAIGIGFEMMRLDSVFPQPHDMPMDIIVTERGLQRRP